MKNDMDHERCSELLLPFLRRELKESERDRVAAHLASCDERSSESEALERVLGNEITRMTEAERAGLHAGVTSRLDAPGTESAHDVLPAPRSSRLRRALPALGAVAVIALGTVFAANLLSGGADDGAGGGDAGGGGQSSTGDDSGEALLEDAAPEAAPSEAKADDGRVPYFKPGAGKIDGKNLERLANEGAFRALSGFRSSKAGNLRFALTESLSDQAPPGTRDQVKACVDSVAGSQGSVLPAYGAEGKYKGKEALLLGFVSGADSGPLNRYMLWLWPKGSCDVPLDYLSGPLKK